MSKSCALISLLFSLYVMAINVSADEITTLNSNVRALGMGDAFTALVSDSSSLFYNPAGLARVHGINWKIIDVRAGASGMNAYNKISGLKTNSTPAGLANAIDALYGDHVWAGGGGEMAFTAPMFGFAVYDHGDALVKIDNPVFPQAYTAVVNDYGYVFGLGVPVGPFFQAGFDLKYIKRTGRKLPFGAASLADLKTTNITSSLTQWGRGYGADAGFNFILPAPIFTATFSTVWRNIGQMSFRSDNPSTLIPIEDNDVTLGLALRFDTPVVSVTPAVDFRYLNSPAYQMTRKLNFGLEVSLPLLDIRGGFHEGYYTYGVGASLGLIRVDLASYGVELGAYPGQIEDRRYAAEFTMELGVGGFSADGSSGGGKNGRSGKAGGSGSSSSSSSFWGSGRHLKQRR